MPNLLIYVIFLYAFFGNTLVEKGLISPYVSIITEALVFLLFFYSLIKVNSKDKRYTFSLWPVFTIFLLISLCSVVINNYLSLKPIISLRLILRFYFFYLALINLELKDYELRKINKLLFILFIIQLPVVAYKFSFRGISEDTIGTYATHGGGLTPIIPVVALGYLAGFFAFYKTKFYYLILAVGFILLGIAGEKRVLLFVYPIAFIGIYFLAFVIGKKINVFKQVAILTFIAVLSTTASWLILKYHKGYNYNIREGKIMSFREAAKYAKEYSTQREGNRAGGRLAMTQLAFEISSKNNNIIFGFGPGALTDSMISIEKRYDTRLIPIYESYGKTGLVVIFIEYGLLGLIAISCIFFSFAKKCWEWYRSEDINYWKAFAMGCVVFTVYNIFIFFCYNRAPLLDDLITPVYFYGMAVMHIKLGEKK